MTKVEQLLEAISERALLELELEEIKRRIEEIERAEAYPEPKIIYDSGPVSERKPFPRKS